MIQRRRQFASKFNEYKIEAYLITNSVNITYLTDFPASESWLLIFPKKAFYITDFRYVLEARQGLKGVTVKTYTKSIITTLFDLMKIMKAKRLGFDSRHVSLALFNRWKKNCPVGITFVEKNNVIEQLREIKSRKEIAQIRKAIKLNLEACQYLKRIIKPGISEKDVLFRLERYVKSREASFSFEPIIASGPNSCFPHATVTKRKICNNEPVLIDMGIDIGGYKSDLTRMFFLGKIPPLVRRVNDAVQAAQIQAIRKIRAGIKAAEIDQEARNLLKKYELDKYFGHSLGHGVGLEVHEGPRISHDSSAVLKEGMVFTVEPAVYLPQQFGIRIEDMVLVKKDTCEVLSRS